MKAQDIISQLALKLPLYTDLFTTNFSVTSLARVSTTVTAETSAAHGLVVGQQVNIQGAKTPIAITSLTRLGTTGTLVVGADHDLTEVVNTSVEISGATEAEFNGTFTIIAVTNRRTVTFTMADSGAVTATGTPLLLNGSSVLQQYNGLYAVATVPDTTHFTYEIVDTTLYTPPSGTILARTNPRVSGAESEERLIEAYTQKPLNALWAFVVLGDVSPSKDRAIESDAVTNTQRGEEFRQQIIQPFSIIVFMPTSSEITGRLARDTMEDIFRPLCRSILFKKLDSGLYVAAQNPIHFIGHGFAAYNSAFYVHTFSFGAVADILFEDTVGYDEDVAFRDINLNMGIDINSDVGLDVMTATIDLDDWIL